ncbi:tricarballylate utilization protein TcuB, partial [Salmonella enterica subsp. enterica serovar Infantis]|nr:tricarballylate utilization protein TcuB [Salmonella enterica subsp. enterica serovar Infantis]
ALAIGVRRFWRNVSPVEASREQTTSAALEASANVATLKYLDGGHGEGCNNADDRFTLWRRRFHHFTFYGFMLCFAATGVATLYHFLLGWSAPYPVLS